MKQIVVLFILVACCWSCGSPDKKPAGADSTAKRVDSVSVTRDSAAVAQNEGSRAEYFLDEAHFSVPPYGLEKIKALIPRIKWYDDTLSQMSYADSLDTKAYDSLSFREKFTYNMIHPEGYSTGAIISRLFLRTTGIPSLRS